MSFIVSQMLKNTADHKRNKMNILCGTAQPQSSKVTPIHGDKHVTDLTYRRPTEKKKI